MTANLKAIYENGVLRLKEPLSLPDGAVVSERRAQVKDYDKAMSTAELLEHVRALPARERRKLVEMILELE
jgi:predicted DNA-binding antitoxin AbrB/MazE fold protein